MPIVTDEVLALTYAGLKTQFDLAYYRANPNAMWAKVATTVPTTLPIQNYGFLGQGIMIEKFIDRIREQKVIPYTYLIADDIYKGAMKVERKALEDDQYGLLQRRVDDIAGAATRFMNRHAFGNVLGGLQGGFTNLCLDGQYFFDTDHPGPAGTTYSNKTSAVLSDAALDEAQQAMGLMVDDKGESLEVVPDTLVVGPKLARLAWELVGSPLVVIKPGDGAVGTGATMGTPIPNFFSGKYDVIVSPYIRNKNWFLLDTSRAVKPLIVQERTDVPDSTETDMLDGAAKLKDEYTFGIRMRKGFGYGLPQLAYGSDAA